MTLPEETRQKRSKRRNVRKKLSEINNIGKRISFVRDKLALTLAKIAEDTGVPIACLADREAGKRTAFYEEILVLSYYFNRRWQDRFKGYFPKLDGWKVEAITPMFILFGEDPDMERLKHMIQEQQEEFKRREIEMLEEKLELKAQIDMFEDPKRAEEIRQKIKKEKEIFEKSKITMGFNPDNLECES